MDARRPSGTRSPGTRKLRRLIAEPSSPSVTASSPGTTLRALVREIRLKQWIKNFACLAGLIFSGQLFWFRSDLQAALGFLSFCFASSSVYILNDVVDREKDRQNPRTASRPIASGELSVGLAIAALACLVVAANAIAMSLGSHCALVVNAYLALNVLYSTRLKRAVIADVMCIAFGFVLRVMYGVYAVGAVPTPWIVLCMFFLALFLGFAKRRGELASFAHRSNLARPVLRKYSESYLDTLLMVTATLAILCYAMFTVVSHKNPTLIVTIVPVVYCIFRYLLHVMMHSRGESPDSILLTDKRLWSGMVCWISIYLSVSYFDINIFQ
jgi:4-hydroxybenzoate polyprenyltransferase